MLYTKEEIESKIKAATGMINLEYDGLIKFFFKGELVGETPLTRWSMMEQRHLLAELCKVAEYDNFHIVRDGKIIDASTVFMDGLMSGEDVHINRGLYEGLKYQIYKNKIVCKECGANHYKAIFPEQKEIIDAIYNKSSENQNK